MYLLDTNIFDKAKTLRHAIFPNPLSLNPLTLLNSRVLWVASITLWANAIDAMNKSF